MRTIKINTDGGSRGNPGLAGAGFIIKDAQGNILKQDSEFLGTTTNNSAEYQAVIFALKAAKQLFGKETKEISFEVYLDSELVQKQLSGQYQIKEETLFSLFIKIWNSKVKDFPNIKFIHIERAQNKEADTLANNAMDKGENKSLLNEK